MCVWASTNPGRTVSFDRSITVAPAGIARLAPTSLIFSPSIMMIWLAAALPVSGSISRPALIAVTVVGVCACTVTTIRTQINNKNDFATHFDIFLSMKLGCFEMYTKVVRESQPGVGASAPTLG